MKRFHTIRLALPTLMLATSLFAEEHSDSPEGTEIDLPVPSNQEASAMKITINIDGHSVTATLIDNPTTRDFISLLPLTLTLDDYASTEKIAYLSRKLSREDAPEGFDPSVGDITYYAPWGNLALFYKDFGYAKGLIKLGSIDEGVEAFNVTGSVTVTIEP